jgi:alkylated DNA repair dioxygenase AlkB
MYTKNIPGLHIIENFINEVESNRLVNYINNQKWDITLSRRTQQYGYKYDYFKRKLFNTQNIPKELNIVCEKLSHNVDQIIVNEYKTNQSISKHIDHKMLFGDTISIVSLLEPVDMIFRKNNEKRIITLHPNSCVVLKNQSRYLWTHELKFKGKRRISVTFRFIKNSYL